MTHTDESTADPIRLESRVLMRLSAVLIAPLLVVAALAFADSSKAATPIDLGTVNSFAVLGGSGVTNTGPSVINGDLGTSPNPSVTGFGGAPNGSVNGTIHRADAVAAGAQADLTTAYNDAAGQGPPTTLATELGGQTLTPGVYNSASGTFGITGTLTLNAQGDPDAVFIFQAASTLITASASRVELINSAQSCRVYWRVGSSATLDTGSTFVGNLFAQQSISLNSGVDVDGRLLARSGAVTLINDTVTRAQCAASGGPGTPGGGGGGNPGGGENPGGGGGGGTPGGGGGGGGNQGGGNQGGGGNPSVGNLSVMNFRGIPNGKGRISKRRCVDQGFRARFRVHSSAGLRRVEVFVGGRSVKTTNRKRFSVWVSYRGVRPGPTRIRLVAVDRNGRRSVAAETFRYCRPGAPAPDFTG